MITLEFTLRPRTNTSKRGKENDSFFDEVKRQLAEVELHPVYSAFKMYMTFIYKRPKSHPDHNPNRIYKSTTPYVLNLASNMVQALKGIAYDDVKMMVGIVADKVYGRPDEADKIEVKIVPCSSEFRDNIDINAGGGGGPHTSAREARRETNRLEHRIQQAEKHERLSIERRAKREANQEAHRLEQEERDRTAEVKREEVRERNRLRIEQCREGLAREKEERERQAKIAKEQAFRRQYFSSTQWWSDDDE